MPNWVYNRVHGSKKAVEKLLDSDGTVTFQNIVPVPSELKALDAFPHEDKDELLALIHLFYDNDNTKLNHLLGLPKNAGKTFDSLKDELINKYPLAQLNLCYTLLKSVGTFYWYDWRCTAWGCKWDASDDFGTYDGTEEEIEFLTPWSPPKGVMDAFASQFPDEQFVWHCDEESCDFSIDFIFNGDGTISEEDVFPEYYTPYIPDEDYLRDAGIEDMTKLSAVKECIRSNMGEACFDIDKETLPGGKCNITLTVYDWQCYGGDALYSVTYNNLEDDEDDN